MLTDCSAARCRGLLITLALVASLKTGAVWAEEPGAPVPVTYDKKAILGWVRELKAENADDRRKAAAAIRQVAQQSHAAVQTLFDAAMEGESGHESAMFELLIELGPLAVPVLRQALWDEKVPTRARAIRVLGSIGFDARAAAPSLRAALKDPDPLVRAFAALALGDVRAYSSLPDILKLLDESEPWIRLGAVQAAIDLGAEPKMVIPALLELMVDDDFLLTAAETLARLGPEAQPAVPALVRRLAELPSLRQGPVIRTLAAIGPDAKDALPTLKGLLDGKPEDVSVVRLAVAEALWLIGRDARAASVLKEYLADPKSRNPLAAAELLWRIDGPTSVVPALVRLLKDESRPDREREAADIAYLLGKIGPGAKDAEPVLGDLLSSPALRVAAAEALGRIGSPAKPAVPALLKISREGDDWAKVTAACAAARIQTSEETVLRLAEGLKAETDSIRVVAAKRLGLLGAGAKPAVLDLRAARKNGSEKLRHAAALALWQIAADEGSLPVLISLLRSTDAEVRGQAAQDLTFYFRADAKPAVPALMKMLFDREIWLRSGAAEALGRIGPSAVDATPALRAILLGDDDDSVHSAACEALGLIGPTAREAKGALKQHLSHPNRHVRVHAALALWHVAGDRSGEPILAPCLRSRSYHERIVAAETLWRMSKDQAALQLLLRTLNGPDPRSKDSQANELYMVVRALGRIGPAAKDAVPELVRKLDDEDPAMVRTAAEALKAIDPVADPRSKDQ